MGLQFNKKELIKIISSLIWVIVTCIAGYIMLGGMESERFHTILVLVMMYFLFSISTFLTTTVYFMGKLSLDKDSKDRFRDIFKRIFVNINLILGILIGVINLILGFMAS